MGTQDIEILQKLIRNHLSSLGWSFRRLADEVYAYENGLFESDEDAIKKCQERIKKHLSRKVATDANLKKYVKVIEEHEEFRTLNTLKSTYVPSKHLTLELERGLKAISDALNDRDL